MACECRFTKTALAELDEILAFLTSDYPDPAYASNLLDGYEHKAAEISENPEMYRVVDEPLAASFGYRKFTVKNYCFLYAIANDAIEIKHIIHEKRDYAGLL